MIKKITVLLSLLVFGHFFSQQTCVQLEVEGNDGNNQAFVDCNYPLDENSCLNLTADYTPSYATNSYSVSEISFDNTISIDSGTIINQGVSDDTWGEVIDLPFRFFFFGNSFNKIFIGDNGVVSFNTSL